MTDYEDLWEELKEIREDIESIKLKKLDEELNRLNEEKLKNWNYKDPLDKPEDTLNNITELTYTTMCLKCGKVKSGEDNFHVTYYKVLPLGYLSCSPLCENCWQNSSLEEKKVYYHKFFTILKDSFSTQNTGGTIIENFHWDDVWIGIKESLIKGY